jgi:hypothetical protein
MVRDIRRYITLVLFSFLYSTGYCQKIETVDGCVCFYLNALNSHEKIVNFGLYDTALMKLVGAPDEITPDSVFFFSINKSLVLEKKLSDYHFYDVVDFSHYDGPGIWRMLDKSNNPDSLSILTGIYNSCLFIANSYSFYIFGWLYTQPIFRNKNSAEKPKGALK